VTIFEMHDGVVRMESHHYKGASYYSGLHDIFSQHSFTAHHFTPLPLCYSNCHIFSKVWRKTFTQPLSTLLSNWQHHHQIQGRAIHVSFMDLDRNFFAIYSSGTTGPRICSLKVHHILTQAQGLFSFSSAPTLGVCKFLPLFNLRVSK
jgi:hypothetical protein